LATQGVTGARWSASLRRVPEAFLAVLPFATVLIIAIFLGRHVLYSWSNPGAMASEPAISGKLKYLQPNWVFARALMVLAVWLIFARLFRRTSLQQDVQPERSLALHRKLNRYAVMFVPVFALTITVAAFDWLISTDPRWFSTMYAVYVFAGTFVQGIAAVTLAVVFFKERGPMADSVSDHQLHDLGKMLFAFSTFWAYIWTCQYLLIWYGNIPEEVTHYVSRTNGPWVYLFALNLVVNWVIPFLVLLSVRAKCTNRVLKAIAILLLCGHWLDLYLLVMPTLWKGPRIGFYEIAIAAGYMALSMLVFLRSLRKAPLVPLNDPILAFEHAHGLPHHEVVHPKLRGVAQ
ncbi:MAG TPA: hypothetical protein VE133_19075, partial [Candidatus Sulfotelmatobacter sp.]|nr:hypothetical protein [Candidatus Sulfotelmatobacter sp.]